MKKNGFDTKNPDFIWNKNRLVLEKEAIKRQMMSVINKKAAKKDKGETDKWNWYLAVCIEIVSND